MNASHRRGPAVGQAILDAAVAELQSTPFDDVSVAGIAERAGVHETSVYRRWKTRDQLLLDALAQLSAARAPVPDTGSLRGDLLVILDSLIAYLRTPLGTALLRLSVNAPSEKFWLRRRQALEPILERAAERGELRPGVDGHLLLAALISPLHMRVLLTSEPLDADLGPRLVDLLLNGAAG